MIAMTAPKRVLFLCTGNSARSQLAEALTRHYLGDRWEPYSAGTKPAPQVHPLAVRVLAELGIDASAQRPKSLLEFRQTPFDLVITVCDSAAQNCPAWLGEGHKVHLGFPDPAAATGTEEEQLAVFRQVRDAIRAQVLAFLEQWEAPPPSPERFQWNSP
jgi:arsenate reductase